MLTASQPGLSSSIAVNHRVLPDKSMASKLQAAGTGALIFNVRMVQHGLGLLKVTFS
jgi:hypothetical protein